MHNIFGKTPRDYEVKVEGPSTLPPPKIIPITHLTVPKRPIFYPKDAPMDKLLPLEASLKDIKPGKETYIPDSPISVALDKGLKLFKNFFSYFNGERQMERKLNTLDTPEVLGIIRKIDPEKLLAKYNIPL